MVQALLVSWGTVQPRPWRCGRVRVTRLQGSGLRNTQVPFHLLAVWLVVSGYRVRYFELLLQLSVRCCPVPLRDVLLSARDSASWLTWQPPLSVGHCLASLYLGMDAQGTLESWSESNLAKKPESLNARKWMVDFKKFKLGCLDFCCVNVDG